MTFLDNHDTGSTQRHWSFPDENLAMGYAYILTHPGVPCIVSNGSINGTICWMDDLNFNAMHSSTYRSNIEFSLSFIDRKPTQTKNQKKNQKRTKNIRVIFKIKQEKP